MSGFFTIEEKGKNIPKRESCLQCGLYKNCISPRMKPSGEGREGIFILAEAPGKLEDEKGTQLIGKAGKFLRRKLYDLGIDLDLDCKKMNAVNCRPERNRTPTTKEIFACRNRVLREINTFKPKIIILLGGPAVTSVIGNVWKKNIGGITKWRGWTIPDYTYNAWICPTFHPAFVIREEKNPAAELIFFQDLQRTIKMINIDLPKINPPEQNISILEKDKEAIYFLRSLINSPPKKIAFDFETTGLKPERPEHDIISCSIATNSYSASAFLMKNKIVRKLLCKILTNPAIKKVGANIKFEHNWSRAKLGIEILGWEEDVCIDQHILDNRSGICGVKFISYVDQGISDYDSKIASFLKYKGKDGNGINQIHKIPIRDLLLYNGIDSKIEFSISERSR